MRCFGRFCDRADIFCVSFLHALLVGKFDALWSHADESTVNVKAAVKEGQVSDKKKAGKKTK